jgi:hypothetical protein
MKRQDDLPTFAGLEGSDTQQFMTPRDAAKNVLSASESPMRWPRETSRWFAEISEAITSEVEQAERGAGERATKEFRSSVTDFRILAALARYYSWRLQAAVAYNLYKESGDLQAFDTALDKEKRAIEAWRAIVDAAAGVYNDKLPFGAPGHFPRHWREELQRLNADFESLVAARKTAPAKPDARSVASTRLPPDGPPPLAILSGAETARPGEDVDVTAKATSSARVKWVRLRYRHLTQYEDYQTADMTLDPETGTYKGRIPGSFVDPKWDLIYFVEVMDAEGRGRMYPDLEKETPYIVVGVQR